ncbi:MAG TPA: glycine zipper family protein [Alphaproteobacteria bacterium]|nr:glycine zipper family protein [Alphaproteobacteria bacterium]
MRRSMLATAIGLALTLGACADMTSGQQRTLSGAAMGSAGGLAIGAIAGDAGMGALIGAGVGAAGGYLYDRNQQSKQAAYERGVQDGQSGAGM